MNSKYILGFSLAANAAFAVALGLALRKPLPSQSSGTVSVGPETASAALSAVHAAEKAASETKAPEAWSNLNSGDLSSLVANLKARGYPPRLVRAIVRSEIEAANGPRRLALLKEAADIPYWSSKANSSFKLWQGMNSLRREENEKMLQLLGEEGYPEKEEARPDGNVAYLAVFSAQKAAAIDRLQSDYNDLRTQLFGGNGGVMLPEDREKYQLLEKEARQDLVALLSPAELREYDLRFSNTAMALRGRYSSSDLTEVEYKALYDLQSAFDQKYNNTFGADQTTMQSRGAAQQQLEASIKGVLGDERYKDLQRSQDYAYRTASQIATRMNLPASNAKAVYDLEKRTRESISALNSNRGLTQDERSEAFQKLSSDYSGQLNQLLTEKGSATYRSMAGGNSGQLLDAMMRRGNAPRAAIPLR